MATAFTLLLLSFLPLALSPPPSTAPAPPPAPSPPTRPLPTSLHFSPPRNLPTLFPPSPPRKPLTSPIPSPPRRLPTSPPAFPPRIPSTTLPPTPPPLPPRKRRVYIQPVSEPQPPPLPPIPAPASASADNPQLDNIADALIGSGDFGNWIDLLMSAADNGSSPLPGTATLFVPDDIALPQPKNPDPYPNQVDFDPFLFAYHVVPRRLSFADLRACAIGSRLPTLLPGNSLIITNNSFSNFTVNGSPITHPDLYLNGAVSVQGVGEAFDYKRFGTEVSKTHPAPPPTPPPTQPVRPPPYHTRETSHGYRFFPAQISGGAKRSGSNFFVSYRIPLVFGFCIMIKSLLIFIR